MKTLIACASALLLASACGVSGNATAALTAMKVTDGKSGAIKFSSKSGSGDKVTFNDVVLQPEGASDAIKAKTMVLSGLNVSKDGSPWFTDMTLSQVEPAKAEDGMSLVFATVSVKHANESTGVFLTKTLLKDNPGDAPPLDQWELGQVSFNGLKVVGDLKKMGQGSGTFNVNMDELSMSDLKKSLIGGMHLGGLKGDFNIPADGPTGYPIAGKFDFGAFDVKGIRAGAYADSAKAGAAAGTSADPTAAMTKNMTDMFAKMTSPIDPNFDSATWTPMSLEASGVKLTTTKLDYKVTRNAQGVATAANAPRWDLNFTANPADGQLGAQVSTGLAALGVQSIDLYGEADATFDPASDTTKYAKDNFGLGGVFDFKMTGGLQGLLNVLHAIGPMIAAQSAPPANGQPAAAPDMSALEQLKVIDLDLTLTNQTLVDSILGLSSMAGGSDAEATRKDVINMITGSRKDLVNAGLDDAMSQELTTAVASFMKQPGALNIKLKPAQPVALFAKGQKPTKASLGFSAIFTPGAAPAPAQAPAKPK